MNTSVILLAGGIIVSGMLLAGVFLACGLLVDKVLNERSHIPPKRPPEA